MNQTVLLYKGTAFSFIQQTLPLSVTVTLSAYQHSGITSFLQVHSWFLAPFHEEWALLSELGTPNIRHSVILQLSRETVTVKPSQFIQQPYFAHC